MKRFLSNVDWHQVFLTTAKLVAIGFTLWAVAKTGWIAHDLGWAYAVAFSGLHLPMTLYSCLFTVWLLDRYEAMGMVALLSTVLNALLI